MVEGNEETNFFKRASFLQEGPEGFVVESPETEEGRYYQRLEAVADLILEIRDCLDNKSDKIKVGDVYDVIHNKLSSVGFQQKDIEAIVWTVKKHLKGLFYIKELVERFKSEPREIFYEIFKIDPPESLEVQQRDGFLVFVMDESDLEKIRKAHPNFTSSKQTERDFFHTGLYLRQSELVKDENLQGRIIFIAKSLKGGTSEIPKKDREETIRHELIHAVNINLLTPVKANILAEKPEGLKRMESYKFFYLEEAKHSYWAGNFHRKFFTHEFGPGEFYHALRKRFSSLNEVEFDLKFGEEIKEYRRLFFMMSDVFKKLISTRKTDGTGFLDEDKMFALSSVLPIDRIERVLHFVGVDPVKWKEEWLKSNTDDVLLRSEQMRIRSEF